MVGQYSSFVVRSAVKILVTLAKRKLSDNHTKQNEKNKQLDAGYPESKEDSLINEMFERIAEMSSVRSIETKCSIQMYRSTKTQAQSQCLNKQRNPAKVECKKS